MAKPQLDADIIQCRADLQLARERLIRKSNIVDVAPAGKNAELSPADNDGLADSNATTQKKINPAEVIEVAPLKEHPKPSPNLRILGPEIPEEHASTVSSHESAAKSSSDKTTKNQADSELNVQNTQAAAQNSTNKKSIPTFSLNSELLSRDRTRTAARRTRASKPKTASAGTNRGIEDVIKKELMISEPQPTSEESQTVISAQTIEQPTEKVKISPSQPTELCDAQKEKDQPTPSAKDILEASTLTNEERMLLTNLPLDFDESACDENETNFKFDSEIVSTPTEEDTSELETRIKLALSENTFESQENKLEVENNSFSDDTEPQTESPSITTVEKYSFLSNDLMDDDAKDLISTIVANDISAYLSSSTLPTRRTCKYAAF